MQAHGWISDRYKEGVRIEYKSMFTILMVYNNTNLDSNMENEFNDFLSENLHKRVIVGGDLNGGSGY